MAIVASVLTIITALVFGLLPLLLADFFYVAVCFVWDFILFCLWCAVFGLYKREYSIYRGPKKNWDQGMGKEMVRQTENMKDAVWIDLVLFLLFLVTTVTGVVGLWAGRSGTRRTAAV